MKRKFIITALISLCAISVSACGRNRPPAETNPQDTSINAPESYSDTAKSGTTRDDLNRQTGGTADRNTATDMTRLPNSDIGQSIDARPGTTDPSTSGGEAATVPTAPTTPNTGTPGVSTPGADTQGAATRDSTSSTNAPGTNPNTGRSTTNPNDIANPNPSSYPSSG